MVKKFFSIFIFSIFILSFFTLLLNYLIDPLWFFSGNKITKINYSWDERSQKLHRFIKTYKNKKINCLIFGSSTSTVINTSRIKKYNCYNFSFSGGSLREYYEILEYLKKIINPEIIVLEVNFNLNEINNNIDRLPVLIIKKEIDYNISYILKNYLSLDSLRFSFLTLINKPTLLTAFNIEFEPFVLADSEKYKKYINNKIEINPKIEFYSNSDVFIKIKNSYPQSKLIGFIHPFHPKYPLAIYQAGKLNSYLDTVIRISKNFDEFYDFAIPSEINSDNNNNYDGSHYYPHVYDIVIDRIFLQNENNYGISLNNKYINYKEEYKKKIIFSNNDK